MVYIVISHSNRGSTSSPLRSFQHKFLVFIATVSHLQIKGRPCVGMLANQSSYPGSKVQDFACQSMQHVKSLNSGFCNKKRIWHHFKLELTEVWSEKQVSRNLSNGASYSIIRERTFKSQTNFFQEDLML